MSETHQSLDDILKGVEPVQEAEPVEMLTAEQSEVEEAEEAAPAAAVEEPKSEGQKQATVEDERVPLAALKDERRKRQELEKQLQEWQAKAQPQQKAPDIFEDPDGYSKHMEAKLSQALMNERANISEFMARREYPDLDQKVEVFKELAAQDPSIQQRVLKAISPYHELVDIVNKHERMKAMENIDEYEAKIRAEIEAKVRAELQIQETERADKDAKVASIRPSLANARSTVKGTDEPYDKSLRDIFGR